MPDRPRVVITDHITQPDIERRVLDGTADIECLDAHSTAELFGRVSGSDVLICCHAVEITGAVLSEANHCRGVVRAGVGYNNIDLQAAAERGMVVCNVPDYGTEEVADHALALLLALARRLVPALDATRRGQWVVGVNAGCRRLRGQTLGIIGCGRIGSALAMRAKALGLRIVIYDPYLSRGLEKALGVERVWRLDELLPQCQFLSLNCPLTDETRHVMNARTFALLPRGAYLVNTARGGLVDEAALLGALTHGPLDGAAIDVSELEPPTNERLWTHPKLLMTPHCAFYSVEAADEMRSKAAQEALRLLRGEPPLNPVNRHLVQRTP